MKYLDLPNAPVESADILILPVPYERTVTYQGGTGQGPAAILDASSQLEFYEEDAGWCPSRHLKSTVLPSVSLVAATETEFHQQLFQTVQALPRENLLIALGGEHSITPEMVYARMPEGGTIVQIDAHADLRPSYHGSVYNHACPMYRLWQKGYSLLQIGLRSLHEREAELIDKESRITSYFDRQLLQPEVWQALLERLASLQGPVWLTIDLDGFDPGLISGVGTPQPGGLGWHQGVTILQTLLSNRSAELAGMDIVELVPEANRVSDMLAAKLLQKGISFWGMSRGFNQRPETGSQIGVVDE
ncbi:MAG: agmatinase [Candidatus Thiodiazotropha lotti]|nr:agmatinase [Candidatus Thiodiazotropha lotti]MCG8005349.1 agmatinase [Candidatus Thiodiazotropha lotti]MCW4188976.1 agmatinase [Candidatus Thiodiazotropha lotti]MCW4201499.1 agmatinase [Candidatus Thiodiazotropha lotti]